MALRFLAGEAFGGGSPRSPPTSRTAISALVPSVDDRPRAVEAGEEQRVDETVVALVVGGKDRRDGADAVVAEVAVALVTTGVNISGKKDMDPI